MPHVHDIQGRQQRRVAGDIAFTRQGRVADARALLAHLKPSVYRESLSTLIDEQIDRED